ncbi:peptide methionine sulfoxide reductase-like [Saccoglossus kowalevskii]|uniref:peptide-methionine (S)-S-oxide reductase n=1 Tax=Saccoglossus kowalevskii TaxID=10224 RepID=A0ABM0LWZ3_SACKO|nr:PREDICTED: peptide methionine sulfoxide reductase-like [Saccoglossus kowalevskii]
MDFDPKTVSYESLLKMFWENHDSTACHNRQYMSAIFYHDDQQKELAEKTRDEHQKTLSRTIATKIKKADRFYEAEDYHQKYLLRNNRGLFASLNLSAKEILNSHVATRLNGYVGGYGMLEQFNKECDKLGLSSEQAKYIRQAARRGPLH